MAIRTSTLAGALAAGLALAAAPAAAQDGAQDGAQDDPQDSPGEMAREGVQQLMNAIEMFVHSLPMYGAPRVDDEGNIVIPRLDDDDGPQRTPERKPDKRAPDPRDRTPSDDGGVTEI